MSTLWSARIVTLRRGTQLPCLFCLAGMLRPIRHPLVARGLADSKKKKRSGRFLYFVPDRRISVQEQAVNRFIRSNAVENPSEHEVSLTGHSALGRSTQMPWETIPSPPARRPKANRQAAGKSRSPTLAQRDAAWQQAGSQILFPVGSGTSIPGSQDKRHQIENLQFLREEGPARNVLKQDNLEHRTKPRTVPQPRDADVPRYEGREAVRKKRERKISDSIPPATTDRHQEVFESEPTLQGQDRYKDIGTSVASCSEEAPGADFDVESTSKEALQMPKEERPRRSRKGRGVPPWQGDTPIQDLDPIKVESAHLLLFSKLTEAFGSDPDKFIAWLAGLNDAAGTVYFDRGNGWPKHVWEIVLPAREINAVYYIKMMLRYSVARELPNGDFVWRCYDPKGLLRMARLMQGRSFIPERQREIWRLCNELGHPELFRRPMSAPEKYGYWLVGFFEARGRLRLDNNAQKAYAEIKWHERETLDFIRTHWGFGRVVEDIPTQPLQSGEAWWSTSRAAEVTPETNTIAPFVNRIHKQGAASDMSSSAPTSDVPYKLVVEGRRETALLKKYLDTAHFKGTQAIDLVRWSRSMLFIDRGYHRETAPYRGKGKYYRLAKTINERLPDVVTTVGITPKPLDIGSWDAPGGEGTRDREPMSQDGWIEQVDEDRLRRTTGRTKPTVGQPGYVETDPNEVEEPRLSKREKRREKNAKKKEEKELRHDQLEQERAQLLTGDWADDEEKEIWARLAEDGGEGHKAM